MAQSRQLPNFNQLSVLIATILLAYAGLPYISLPQREVSLSIPGFVLSVQIGSTTALGLLVAGLSGSGTYWILRRHPQSREHPVYEHLILPGLTALVIGLPLSALQISPIWWVIFGAGGFVLVLVIMAEYITMDPDDIRQPVAAGFLTAVAYAIFLLLVINTFASGTRLFILLPVTFTAAGLVTLRVLRERIPGLWMAPQAVLVALIAAQLAAAFHYLPISALTAGLFCVGPTYSLTQLTVNLRQGQSFREAFIEPGVSLLIIGVIGLWIR